MEIVCAALTVYWLLLFARIILSWVQMAGSRPPGAMGPVVKLVYDATEPVLGFVRRMIPPVGMFDLSPLIVFLLLGFIQRSLGCGGLF